MNSRRSVLAHAPAWIIDGAHVWYQSSPGPEHRYAGVVDGTPRLLGGHTWVVRLRHMDPRYRNGDRTTVPAAACHCLEPRVDDETWRLLGRGREA